MQHFLRTCSNEPHADVYVRLSSSSSSNEAVDVVWQDRLSISRNNYDRGSIVIFR